MSVRVRMSVCVRARIGVGDGGCVVSCPEFWSTSHPDKTRLDEDVVVNLADLDLVRECV